MQTYLATYKPFLLFLGKFILCYALLTGLYSWYLGTFDAAAFEVDGMTNLVAQQTEKMLLLFTDTASVLPHLAQPSLKIFYQNEYVARVVEGCNALSVMILFAAFVVAFTGKFKTTVLFIVGGCLLIHVLNIGRIAALSAALYYYPEQESLLHDILFPLAIYGVVFVLWMIWVNKFSNYAQAVPKA